MYLLLVNPLPDFVLILEVLDPFEQEFFLGGCIFAEFFKPGNNDLRDLLLLIDLILEWFVELVKAVCVASCLEIQFGVFDDIVTDGVQLFFVHMVGLEFFGLDQFDDVKSGFDYLLLFDFCLDLVTRGTLEQLNHIPHHFLLLGILLGNSHCIS